MTKKELHLQDEIDDDESNINKNDIENNYDIEDETPDWKILTRSLGSANNSNNTNGTSGIPKRGDKDFEPDNTDIQTSTLQESREAMYDAISGVRGHHLKQKLLSIWIEDEEDGGYSIIPFMKGNYFRDIGKAYPNRRYKNCIRLNPIETVYLVERGSMIIYLGDEKFTNYLKDEEEGEFNIEEELVPVDLELLYSLAFINERYTIDKYQVYSYLKRHGYLILEVDPKKQQPPQWKRLEQYESSKGQSRSIISWGWDWKKWIQSFWRPFPPTHSLHYLTTHYFKVIDIFKSLRLIPTYQIYDSLRKTINTTTTTTSTTLDDYKISFNVWKPGSQFSKSNPSQLPDYQIVVVNTDKVKFPTLKVIQRLVNTIEYRFPFEQPSQIPTPPVIKKNDKMISKRQLKYDQRQKSNQSKLNTAQLNNIEYLKKRDNLLKYGKTSKQSNRNVVIGVINNGIINLINLIENEFSLTSESVIDELTQLHKEKSDIHGIVYNGDK
ncbi:hypothetical protein DFJ63DRAFT_310792 [Scheffersomyces coipomensis]|uniref:uncharacterized protein n=1 Tax=Scheffersomyces coipomensis TaxID=1788519 RepID=UPI00315D1FE3